MQQLDLFDMLGELNPNYRETDSNEWKWSFKDYPETEDIKVFSCFACGGGSTMGYKLAGCKVLGDLEIDPRINEVYVKNHNPIFNYVMDIRDFNRLEELPEELYHLDILDGSPPCTCFSMAGDREETWGKKKKFAEWQAEQTLDDLSFHFIETVNKLRPKVVIMENVEGLLLGEAWTYVQRIYQGFNEIGYDLKHYLVKCERLGVPQTRLYAVFVGVRKDLSFNYDLLDMSFNYKPVTYGEIKEGIGREINHNNVTYKWLCKANESDKRIGDVIARHGEKEKLFNYRICWESNVVQTITATFDYYRGKEKTFITDADIIHSQTFPEDYDFMDVKPQYICGMSVPPLMIKRVVERLKQTGIFDKEATHE